MKKKNRIAIEDSNEASAAGGLRTIHSRRNKAPAGN